MLQHGLSEPFQKAGNTALEFIQKLSPTERMAFSNLLGQLDEAGPTSKKLEKFLLNHRPDFLLITPLIFTQYGQFELLKAAKKLSIPVGYLVFSWDNLSTKGVLQINPDAIFLWNEIQRDEVLSKYNFPQEKIYVCGAPRFDYFFEKKPSLSRDQYFQKFDLNPEKKVVTYLCSSNLISNAESDFVIRWLNSIRSSSAPLLKNCNVVIRPHPKFRAQWENFEVPASEGKTTISSSKGLNNDPLLFDTLYFTDVVVGLNTSAQLEAAVLNKPVLTLNVPEFSEGQEGTIHFHYLLKEKGGFVRRASSLETHLEDLKSVLGGDIDSEVIKNFVKKFIRPQGLDKSAADATVDSIEFFASKVVRSGARRSSVWKRLLGS